MSGVLSSQPSSFSTSSSSPRGLFHIRAKTQARLCSHCVPVSVKQQSNVSCLSVTELKTYLGLRNGGIRRTESRGIGIRCNSGTGPAGSGSGDGDSKSVLDAFFLGKALAEALNERIESTVGEFLSIIGRLQAEQQKQIQEFQDDVWERAKKAKEKAAREALEPQGLISKPATLDTTVTDGVTPATSASTTSAVTAVNSRSYSNQTTNPSGGTGPDPAGTAFEVANDE